MHPTKIYTQSFYYHLNHLYIQKKNNKNKKIIIKKKKKYIITLTI